jgi:ribosomal protein L11 methylase PrmA
MKKLATTFGLLALMLIVTSFTTPSEIGGKNTPTDLGTGSGKFSIGGKNTPTDLGTGSGKFSIGGKNTPTDLGTGGSGIGGKNTGTGI